MEQDNKTIWNDCLSSIKVSVSPANFSTWFAQTYLKQLERYEDKYSAEVGCPSPFVKNTIENRYFGLIQDSLSKTLKAVCNLTFTVSANPDTTKLNNFDSPLFQETTDINDQLEQKVRNSRLRPNFTFENFAVSSSNQMAWAAADAVSDNPGNAYNPLFVWGGVGVGKTHLMSSVGVEILKKDLNKKVVLCTGEDFTNDIVEGIRRKTTQAFRDKYRKLDALLIDDIQFIAGKDAVQEEFFHTFNTLVATGSQIILTSDRPPSEISRLEERLRSRFEAGLIVDIAPPDFELRCAILQIKTKERGVDLPMDLIQLIAGNIDSARKIEGFLIKLISEVRIKNINLVTEELVLSILGKGEVNKDDIKKVAPDDLINAVCKHYSIGKRSIMSHSRAQVFSKPRQVLMYLLRTHLNLPLDEVGRLIGGRDHTTVMHAVDKITNLASGDVQIREDIQGIKNIV
jgi:chromosomal replication initiator protein